MIVFTKIGADIQTPSPLPRIWKKLFPILALAVKPSMAAHAPTVNNDTFKVWIRWQVNIQLSWGDSKKISFCGKNLDKDFVFDSRAMIYSQ